MPNDVSPQESDSGTRTEGAGLPEVSVVIPCLNEARTVGSCVDSALAGLKAAGICGEVIVADNGSTDGSIETAKQHGARVVHAEVKGYGSALRKGLAESRGRFIVLGDADGSHDFAEIPLFVAKWRQGFEVVIGNRFKKTIVPGAMLWHHKYIGNPALSKILNLFFRAGVGDSQCGMRGLTQEAFQRLGLRTVGMEFASEFIIKAALLGVRTTEVAVTQLPDRRGRSPHLRTFRDGWRHFRLILLFAPNWLFIFPGFLSSGLGFTLAMWSLLGPHQIGHVVFDIPAMVFGMIFTMLGVQITAIGLFAKVFSYTEKFDHSNLGLSRWLKRMSLESGLALGLTLWLTGILGGMAVLWKWKQGNFDLAAQTPWLLFWSMIFFVGLQVIFSSFFLSMLGISRGTYIGESGNPVSFK